MKLLKNLSLSMVAMVSLFGMSAYGANITIGAVGNTGTLVGSVGGNAFVFGLSPVLQGVGNSKVFLTIDDPGGPGSGHEKGYNTTGTTEFNTTPSGTTALLISEVGHAFVGGVEYSQFEFALNATGGAPNVSINSIQVFQATAGNLTGFPTFGGNATLVFKWDASAGNTLTVNDYIPGLDNTEMLLMVPSADFGPTGSNIILYMDAGSPGQFVSNDGPDKWIARQDCNNFGLTAVTCGPISTPEPSSLWLLCAGIGLLSVASRKSIVTMRMRKK
jgi:hypothetical protein